MRMWKRGVATLFVACALGSTALVAGAQEQPDQAEPPEPETPALTPLQATGRDLYLRDCAWCHGPTGEGTPRGSSLIDVGAASAYFMLTTGRMPIEEPTTDLRRAEPAYPDEDIAALVAYVATFGEGPEVPDVDVARGDLALGEHLYRTQCAACHGPSGTGAALTAGRIAPDLDDSTPRQVATALVTGPGPMPVFVPGIFSPEEVDAVARYVVYLQDRTNRGGWGLWNLGPVAEGLAAWTAGIVPLLLILLFLGSRRR
jgi:ubiquinol-cytochrome c reductase cytochrome c subunit